MKIAFDAYPIASPHPSGVGVHAWQIAKRICQKGDCELLLYDFCKRRHSGELLAERIPHTPIREVNWLPYGVFVELWSCLPALGLEQLFHSRAQVYHFFNFVLPPRVPGAVVNTVHDLVYLRYPQTMQKANYRRLHQHLRRSCERADRIVTVSQFGARELSEQFGIAPEKIRVVYNGVDTEQFYPGTEGAEEFRKAYGLPEHYFLYIGTLEPRKNLPGLLRAYAAGKPSFHGCKLVLAGARGWEYQEIFRLVEELGLQDDVVFPGYLPFEKLRLLYAASSAFVFPSLYEGFGLPPLEAMACGVPVITSLAASLPEVAGDAALLVHPLDHEELADAMRRILEEEELRNTLREKGFRQVKQFSWDNAAESLLSLYQELGVTWN